MSDKIISDAIAFAKKNRTAIARRLTDKKKYPPEENPVSVFMAGSPGAGKTEVSKYLVEDLGGNIIRLDPDELREQFPDYNGSNSSLFQRGITPIVEKVLDLLFQNDQSFFLDGTLSNLSIAQRNIDRALKRNRGVLIIFVYQEPELAWEFVQAREKIEGRKILPETFVEQFFGSQNVVDEIKKKYEKQVRVDLLIKNNDGSVRKYHANIQIIDHHLKVKRTREDVKALVLSNNKPSDSHLIA
ncbi:zeta toxin family protein [Moritella viscosa]|uniref:AAA ATPase n=1 Tax=Moritella viscosa TaxID=80854 RepID=A0A1L0AJN4_9GAMM|nr:zeta toxin family protein [Moritella viscosa]SGY87670.1 AAA ATPase [Moritella viscosa]SHO00108.1 AAA ATPase [Moritella viscosa]SHO15272.1 AAA ATPase [Moritella viscosa]SHO18914.1 AAA ATPase [Moritella viscosa]